ncbi:MAG: DegV family protein [Acidobacteriota bacterium]
MPERIALMTDSACDLPPEILQSHSVFVLPLKIIYGDQEYRDKVDIQPEEVYDRMPELIPTTSMPSPGEIQNIFDEIKSHGYTKILAMHISSGLSGTFNAVKMIAQEITDMQIEVFDCRTLSVGQGFQIYEAAKDIARGLDLSKILENIEKRRAKVQVFYVIETLEYLKRGGRIGKVAAVLGELLQLKPIISVDDEGKYFTYCKTRGRKQSIDKLAEIIEKAVNTNQVDIAVMHGGALEEAKKLKERLQHLPNVKEMLFGQISPALGVHTGPGLIGVSYVEAL